MTNFSGDSGRSEFDYPGLNALIESRIDASRLMEQIGRQVHTGNIDSPFIEWRLEADAKTHRDVSQLTQLLGGDIPQQSFVVAQTTWLSYHFAHSVSSMALGTPSSTGGVDIQPVVLPGEGYLEAQERLNGAVSDYLCDRPSVDRIISDFVPELDPSQRYPHVVELVAGSAFMRIDEAENRKVSAAISARFIELTNGL